MISGFAGALQSLTRHMMRLITGSSRPHLPFRRVSPTTPIDGFANAQVSVSYSDVGPIWYQTATPRVSETVFWKPDACRPAACARAAQLEPQVFTAIENAVCPVKTTNIQHPLRKHLSVFLRPVYEQAIDSLKLQLEPRRQCVQRLVLNDDYVLCGIYIWRLETEDNRAMIHFQRR